MRKIFKKSIVLVLLMVFAFSSTCLASDGLFKEVNNKPGDSVVTPMVISPDSWNFRFTNNYIKRNVTTYALGEAQGATYLIADAYFKMTLDPYLSSPVIVARSGGLPDKSFIQRYDSSYGGNCWLYESGTVFYNGTQTFSLKASTKASSLGSYKGGWGSYNMIPNSYVTDMLYVNQY